MLLHVLVADLRRFCLEAWQEGRAAVLTRCLDFLDLALKSDDDAVQNAIAVSLVEDIGLWDETVEPFVACWPAALAAESQRQRGSYG